ncbi:MAG: hypothetical protein AB7S75_15825 [Desulfococcaceae bacterium]
MKTGVIVYVVGNEAETHFDEKQAAGNLGVTADRVEFVFSGQSEEDLAYSWWSMTRKGMSRIICMAGEMIAPSNIRLFGHEMQLSAY